MKYICLGYIEPGKFEKMSESERNAMLDECFEYNDHLRANGQGATQRRASLAARMGKRDSVCAAQRFSVPARSSAGA